MRQVNWGRVFFIASLTFWILVVLILAPAANAQFGGHPDVNAVVQSNANLVHDLAIQSELNQLPYRMGRQMRRLAGGREVIFNPAYDAYGYYSGGQFISIMSRPMGRREATITGAAIGAAIGSAATGNWRGAAGGAGGGALIGLLLSRGKDGRQEIVGEVIPEEGTPSELQPAYVPGPELRLRQRTQLEQRPLAGPAATGNVGEYNLTNGTRVSCDVYDEDTYLFRLQAGEQVSVPAPQSRYRCFALIPNRRGSLSSDELELDPTDNGWIFTEPAVAQRAGR